MVVEHLYKKRPWAVWNEDQREQGRMLLRRDPLYDRIPACDVDALIDDAISVGCAQKDFVLNRFKTCDPMQVARAMNVRVQFDISPNARIPFKIMSRYNRRPPTIVVYENTLRQCRENLARHELARDAGPMPDLTSICVAHELYHHLELHSMNFVNLGYKIPIMDLGFIKIEKSLSVLSEIAAHAFARYMLELPYLPCALEPILFQGRDT